MSKFIYFNSPMLFSKDFFLNDKSYEFYNWFQLRRTLEWPGHTTSRVHQLDTPWPLAPTVSPIPSIFHNEMDFGNSLELVADTFCREISKTDLIPYIAWSGGIDSTCILVSLIKVANPEFLKKLVVLLNQTSIDENPYFYHQFIANKLNVQQLSSWEITTDNYNKIVLLDGEAGNQCMGWRATHYHLYRGNNNLLDQDWRTVSALNEVIPGANDLALDIIKESIKHAPVDITSVYDFIWWTNFNFKFDDVLLRKVVSYTNNLNPTQSKDFYENHLYRFFEQPYMQVWSMISKGLRRQKSTVAQKWIAKNYIHQFDRNDLYFSNKHEQPSQSPMEVSMERRTVIAIDEAWNKYSITDSSTRKMLGQILKRI